MKVFISSTYKDLIEYRAAAIRAVEGTNYQASKMEVWGARPDEPITACLKEVEESNLFIGIYALRYGFIPEGADISITEMEYVHAKKLGRSIYCFILDEENQPWLKKWIDGEPEETKLKNLKRRLQKDHVCDYFTTPDDLRAKVANALSNFVANHHPIPDYRIPIYEASKPTGSTLPTQSFFVGREKELEIIKSALSSESRTWGVLIDGPGGMGKTALAVRAAYLAPETLFDRKIFITAKVRELTPEGEKPLKDFSRDNYFSMLNELALELGEEGIPRLVPDERANPLRLAMAGKKTLIVFDNLETLSEDERTRLFQFLSRLPEGNKAIATSRRGRRDIDARSVRLDRLQRYEALQLIEKLAETNPRLAREKGPEYHRLYEITNGNPLLIKWVCGQLGREGSAMHTIAEACTFMDKAPTGNDPLEYVFGDLLETFTESETKVLAALTHFTQPAKLKWVAVMTDLPEQAAETALEDLTDRSILIASNESKEFFLPSLAAKFIRNKRAHFVILVCLSLIKQAFERIKTIDPKDVVAAWKSEIDFYEAALYGMIKAVILPAFQSPNALSKAVGFDTSAYWEKEDGELTDEILEEIDKEASEDIKSIRLWIRMIKILKIIVEDYESTGGFSDDVNTIQKIVYVYEALYENLGFDIAIKKALEGK
ncbi:MAG TPA: DUF4062 domain-containing protein [Anaerolineales bacterium]|nr:DUF4062 domain-containing protein [Anaerolineales bacterium]